MTNPKVTIITPAYNAAETLPEAIKSIRGQAFTDFEYIIIDDGSTDETWDIILSAAASDARILPIRLERNQGVSYARNLGINRARGKYIVWADADDISLPERVASQYAFLEAHSDVGLLGGALAMWDGKTLYAHRRYALDDARLRRHIFRYQVVAQPAAMVRKSCFDAVGLFDTGIVAAEDMEMSFRIGTKFKFANLSEPVIWYRELPGSLTGRKLTALETALFNIRKKYSTGHGYVMSRYDRFYNLSHRLASRVLPNRIKRSLFSIMRDSRRKKTGRKN